MTEKIVIVTGTNTGIGKVTALELLKKGATVILASREEKKTLEVINSIKDPLIKEKAYFIKLNLGSFNSIENFVKEFKRNFSNFDILINNAGATFDYFSLKENIESTMMVNYFGPYALTLMLKNIINPKVKIINVSSKAHVSVNQKSLDYLYAEEDFSNMKDDYRHMMLYSISKLGNVYHAQYLAEKLNVDIKSASLTPGLVNSDLFNINRYTKWNFKVIFLLYPLIWLLSKDVYIGAQTTLHVAYLPNEELNSGAYFKNCAETKIKEFHSNRDKRNEFIAFTEKILLKNWSNANKYLYE